MNNNINIETLNNNFFSPITNYKSDLIRTKIINYSHFSINEANIAHKIKQIPYYQNFFSILEDYEELNVSELNDNIIEKLKNVDEIKYFLFKYYDKGYYDFTDFLYNSISIKKLIFDIITSFQHILYGLHKLDENNISFFNISPNNLVFLSNYREKPVLSNFKFSLQLDKLDYTYISHILNRIEDFTYLPFEIHILYHFIKHKLVTISYSFIEEFCHEYVDNLNILRLFSDNYRKKYKEQCISVMKNYINRPRKDIIEDILERNDKWDVYGISMLYLQIFGCISRVFSLSGTFISKIILELSKNLNPNSDNRMTLEKTLNEFNRLLNDQDDWSFVNSLDNKKINQLFDELSK